MTARDDLKTRFIKALDAEDKDACVELVKGALDRGEIDISALYGSVLAPALNGMADRNGGSQVPVWREHIRSSIVRTVMECCYPTIIKARKASSGRSRGRVVVVCPDGENHEIGARMASDMFALAGFDPVFVGANTPRADMMDLVRNTRPVYVAMSVSSLYNLVAARRTVEALSKIRADSKLKFKIVVGGSAFGRGSGGAEAVGADILVDDLSGIGKLPGGKA